MNLKLEKQLTVGQHKMLESLNKGHETIKNLSNGKSSTTGLGQPSLQFGYSGKYKPG